MGVLKFHMLGNKVLGKDMQSGSVGTLNAGTRLFLTVDECGVRVRDGGINTAHIKQVDVLATNGVVHVTDRVLVSVVLTEMVDEMRWSAADSVRDIMQLLESLPQFSTLVLLLKAADLVDMLKQAVFTVFAPTNYAFGNAPGILVEFLTRPENKQMLVCQPRSGRWPPIGAEAPDCWLCHVYVGQCHEFSSERMGFEGPNAQWRRCQRDWTDGSCLCRQAC